MPKIVLIEPKAPNLHIYSQYKIPRLGPVLLGTMMKERGWEVEVVFEEAKAIDFEALLAVDLVGISTITSTAPRAYALADKLRAAGIPVLMGGPHVTFLAEEALQHCDYVLRGEAEHALMAFLDAWETDRDYSQVPNLSYTLNGGAFHNPASREPINLDDLPYPDLSLFPWSLDQTGGLVSIPVLTSRGCPFQCAFCSVTGLFGRRYRFRSTQNVIGELRRYNHPKKHVFFYDDNFAANRKRLKELLRAMLQEGFQFTWSAQVRIDIAQDEELLGLMKQAGCLIVFIGFESVNPESLQAMKKQQTLNEMRAAVRLIRKYNIRVHGMFVYGFDEDDWLTVRKTVRFAKRFGLSSTQFLILTPLPGSEFYRKIKAENRLLFQDWGLYDAHHVVFRPAKLSLRTLQKAQMFSHKKFYSWLQSGKRIFRRQWLEVGIAHYARNLNRMWKKKNRAFLKVIKLLALPQNKRIRIDYRQDAGLD
jgi:radical SAM superfamily enzyme YgiQ (UPF0313 family)